jgi:hypothetical protein
MPFLLLARNATKDVQALACTTLVAFWVSMQNYFVVVTLGRPNGVTGNIRERDPE